MNNISIILPVHNYKDPISVVLKKINDQILKPNEIIIVDSSDNIKIQEIVRSFNSNIHTLYHWVPKAYPGHSRNIGVKLAKNKYVAFIDSKTLPKKNWLSECMRILIDNNLDYKIGITEFKSISIFQKLVNSATFGNLNYATIPGSVFKKDFFLKSGGFLNYLRSAEDQHYFSKIGFVQKKDYDRSYLTYNDLPSKFHFFYFKIFLILLSYFFYKYSRYNEKYIFFNFYFFINFNISFFKKYISNIFFRILLFIFNFLFLNNSIHYY